MRKKQHNRESYSELPEFLPPLYWHGLFVANKYEVNEILSLPDHNYCTYRICSIRRRSRLVAAYNSIVELNKIVAAPE